VVVLVEVLVAITIFAIGFLALAAMQVSGLRATQVSNYRSLAMFHAQTIADQMRANRVALRLASNPYYSAPPPTGGALHPDLQLLLTAQTDLDNARQTLSDRQEQAAERAAAQTACDDAVTARNNAPLDANYNAVAQAAQTACAVPELSGLPPDVAGAQATVQSAETRRDVARRDAINNNNGIGANDADGLIGALQQASATVSTCTSAVCTAEELARFEVRRWRDALAGSLPQGQGIVCIDSTPDDGDPSNWLCDGTGEVVAIKIGWLEQAAAGAEQGGTLLNTERQRLVVRLAKL